MKVPKHFDGDSKRFRRFIFECALRDLETFLDAISCCSGESYDETRLKTKLEIKEIRRRLKLIGG